jgi:uncharacterized protein YggE
MAPTPRPADLLFGLATLFALGKCIAATELTPPRPTISVTSAGKVTAKPDLAIVFLTVRTSAPLATDALEQNKKKVQEVQGRLTALGYKDQQIKFSGNRFAPTGQGVFFGGGQRPTGFDVYNNVYVYLEAADLKDVSSVNARLGALLDEMGKLGAAPDTMPISRISMGGASIVAFTVKDPSAQEKEAYLQAMEKARPIADDIARRMKVQITGIDSVISSTMRGMIAGGPSTPLDELPYEYISSSMDEVPIRVQIDVRYSYK